MSTLPVLLKSPRILLLGGGRVALRKARVLMDNDIRFEVLAREFIDSFEDLCLDRVVRGKYIEPDDLGPFSIVIDATGNPAVREMLVKERRKRFLLLNIVDDPDWSDFYFSSLLNYGSLKIAVSTDGASPTVGQVVRDRIRRVIPREIGDLVAEKKGERARGIIDEVSTRAKTLGFLGQVDLVGCGPGDADLLTLQAVRCIADADVVLYDHLISPAVLDLVPPKAERVYVGKQKLRHSLDQDEISRLILQYARRGLKVARLKSGDPYIFGRGAEEAEYLVRHGIRVRVIPGISSAVAAPSAAGIPLTARGYASSVSVVSAHLAGSRINTAWLPLLKIPGHTTVVLMGLSCAREIAETALGIGINPDVPVAIVSNATYPTQKTIVTYLGNLAEASRGAKRPAVLVFGDVVRLRPSLPHFVGTKSDTMIQDITVSNIFNGISLPQ